MLKRGFPKLEFEQRVQRAQRLMYNFEIDILFITNETDINYFTGFQSQFWKSPTRPWYLIIPLQGKPLAIVPEIGEVGMQETWIDDILTWPSPYSQDEGISLIIKCIDKISVKFKKIGTNLGLQSSLRMPINNFLNLSAQLKDKEFVDFSIQLYQLKSVKSALEVSKIAHACKITDKGFESLSRYTTSGITERQLYQKMKIKLLQIGADHSPYLIVCSGNEGYDNIIMGPSDKKIKNSDILIIDTGTVFNGYFSDFDRNYAIKGTSQKVKQAHTHLYKATEAGFNIARPGTTTTEIFNIMYSIIRKKEVLNNDVGRLGHGIGKELTEWPSNSKFDSITLEKGMVLTLEPGMFYDKKKYMVHEENILITNNGAKWLSKRILPNICIIK
jgi:Xaa-Pro aminopeptidase